MGSMDSMQVLCQHYLLNCNDYTVAMWGCPGGLVAKIRLPMKETWVQYLGGEDPLEKGMATHSSILAWKIPWTEGPGGLQAIGSQESQTT